jgi:serine/threonine protein kinase
MVDMCLAAKGTVLFEYTALAKAYFNPVGEQVGILPEIDNKPPVNRPVITIGPEPHQMPSVGDLVQTGKAEYRIVSVLGKGTDSVVYKGVEVLNKTTAVPIMGSVSNGVAIKFQIFDDSARKYSVETDYKILSMTSSTLFPKAYYLSNMGSIILGVQTRNIRYLVLELLGASVHDLLKWCDYRLPMGTVASIGMQAVDILERMHSIGLVHGDIHTENIMFKLEGSSAFADMGGQLLSSQIVFGDYGKSFSYIDPATGSHVAEREIEFSKERNMLYLSPFELAFGSPSRREDIFRLMESLCRLIDEKSYTKYMRPLASNREAILNAKRTTPLGDILQGIHPTFASLYDYSRSLAFSETPKYERLRFGFRQLLASQGLKYDGAVMLPNSR